MINLFYLFFISLFAGFSELSQRELYVKDWPVKSIPKKDAKSRSSVQGSSKKRNIEKELRKLMEKDKKIMELLAKQEQGLIIRRKKEKVLALTRVSGILLNSVVAMSVKPSKFIVRIDSSNSEINGAELRCNGHEFERRVMAHCDLMVIDGKEIKADIDIWGIDGAEGITPDYYYSGEEKAFISASFAAFLEGVLDASKDRIATPFGETQRNNAKNKITSGLMGIAGNVKSKINKTGEQKLSIAFINSGRKVLVFFNQTLKLNQEVASE